jgi:hypothetical protein
VNTRAEPGPSEGRNEYDWEFVAEGLLRPEDQPPADVVRRDIELQIISRVIEAIDRVVTDQALNTPLNREALISVVRRAVLGAKE